MTLLKRVTATTVMLSRQAPLEALGGLSAGIKGLTIFVSWDVNTALLLMKNDRST